MTKSNASVRDRKIHRRVHQLFWHAYGLQKWSIALTYAMRIPAYIVQHAIIPLFIAYGLEAIVKQNFDAVPHLVFVIVALSIAHLTMMAVGAWAVSNNSSVAASAVQEKVFANYLGKDFEFYGNNFMGTLSANAARLRDACIEYGLLMTLDVPKQIVAVFAGLVVIGLQAPLLAVVTLFCMMMLLGFTIATSRWRLQFRRRLSQASGDLSGAIADTIGQSAMVKSFASEDYEVQKLKTPLYAWKRAQYISWLSSVPADAGRYFLMAITIGVLLTLTANLYQAGTISIAIVTLVQLYVLKMINTTSDIADMIKRYEATMGSVYQALQTMMVEPAITDPVKSKKLPTSSTKLAVQLQDVSFHYDTTDEGAGKAAISDFSLDIQPGEKIGIVGFSGSGKTTLTKLLLRFMDVTRGRISLGGVDLRDARQHDIRRLIAYVPQEPMLFHRSIFDNIAYGNPKASKKIVLQAAAMGHVDEFAKDLPQQYDTPVGERGVKLSGGQRQRIAIARAIVKDAPILVLDEATSALDSQSEKLIQAALWDLMKNRTAIVIAHRLSTIQKMDRIVVMDRGKIVQIGSHVELLAQRKGIYAKLWSHQSGGYLAEEA